MRNIVWFGIIGISWMVGSSASADTISLFNGKDLSGWTGNADFWKVEEGVIVGQTPGIDYNTFLYTDKEYTNFVLKFKVRLTNHNSGVQFRSEVVDPKKFVMAGYQADIAPEYWGLLYEEKKRGMLDFKMDTKKIASVGKWVDVEVRADGPNITITTNGTKTVQYVEKNDKAGAKSGKIGLQLHGGPAMKVEFKDINLDVLP
jgi:hypothetical protein